MTDSRSSASGDAISCRVCDTKSPKIGVKDGYPIHHCPNCGFLFADGDAPPSDPMAAYHDYGGNAEYLRKKELKLRRNGFRIFRYGWLAGGRRFLDVGCNIGTAVEAARRKGYDATGIDVDAAAVTLAQETFPDAKFENAYVQDFAARGDKYDFIFNQEVIEHVPEPLPVLAAMRDLLAPKGKIWLTTPDAGHGKATRNLLGWQELAPPDHVGLFTRKTLQIACEKAGLKIFFIEPNPKGGLKALLTHR